MELLHLCPTETWLLSLHRGSEKPECIAFLQKCDPKFCRTIPEDRAQIFAGSNLRFWRESSGVMEAVNHAPKNLGSFAVLSPRRSQVFHVVLSKKHTYFLLPCMRAGVVMQERRLLEKRLSKLRRASGVLPELLIGSTYDSRQELKQFRKQKNSLTTVLQLE